MIQKTSKFGVRGFFGTQNPNAVPFQYPEKIGDVYVRTDTTQLFFCVSVTVNASNSTTSQMWGTCGTAGA